MLMFAQAQTDVLKSETETFTLLAVTREYNVCTAAIKPTAFCLDKRRILNFEELGRTPAHASVY